MNRMVVFEYRKIFPLFLGASHKATAADSGTPLSFICMINIFSITFLSLGNQQRK